MNHGLPHPGDDVVWGALAISDPYALSFELLDRS